MADFATQWFPVYPSGSAPFVGPDGSALGSWRQGATATVSIELDTYPQLIYGFRFEVSYELPGAFYAANPDYKRRMREGGQDDDYDIKVTLTQGNITTNVAAHVANIQGRLGINKHPLCVYYPARGGNKMQFSATRNSSYAPVIVADQIQEFTVNWKVTIETARGISSVMDGVTGPPPPGSSGFNQ